MKTYFLDTASTTQPYKEVVDTVADVMYNHYGNPSSIHEMGQDARNIIETVRHQIAEDINCEPHEIIFTGGACEANSLAFTVADDDLYLITTRLEHKSIEMLRQQKIYLPNDYNGNIDLSCLRERVMLANFYRHRSFVSICAANSEIGVIQDIKSISDIAHQYNGILHIDATQLYPEERIDVKALGIDLMSVSAQKFHGPRGIGFLYCKDGIKLKPLIGGSQEDGRRGGTYNSSAIAGMGKALEITRKSQEAVNKMTKANRDILASKLLSVPGVHLNGPWLNANRLCNNLSLCIDGVNATDLVTTASLYGIYISSGSACSSGEAVPSSTLKAIGLTDKQALSTIRITVDNSLSAEDINTIADIITGLISQLRTS